ncbi:glutamine-rich protein 2 [Cyrtonyx montezumae]|uniref:glutamine-rich protein 2 n=1 Tax=Cyrtonyx montezumae TaxID=9017 RepID=UPI0032DA159E
MDDRHQRQRDIETLFQSLERLEKEKADKEELVLEIDVKADRSALASKVSCAQFDAAMEQLNGLIRETLSKVACQEQDWHQAQQKLIEELDSKLDRPELALLRQQLEERWRRDLKQLRDEAPRVEADDAAGIRKQLLAHFHCVSCDRPLHMLAPGPHILTIPPLPPLPPRTAVRPHGPFQSEHGRRWGTWGTTCDTRLVSSPGHPSPPRKEQGARGAYLQVPRRCGGQHTITHPLQRCPQPPPYSPAVSQSHSSITKEVGNGMPGEVGIPRREGPRITMDVGNGVSVEVGDGTTTGGVIWDR